MERLLVIDDEAVTLELIRAILTGAGYAVDAHTSLAGLPEPWEAGRWDCIVSDYALENQTGAELLDRVRGSGDLVPFIFLTGNAGLRTAIKSIQAGANDYLVKPFESEVLLLTIQRNLQAAADRRILNQLQAEKEAVAAERRQIVHWRDMYAAKEARQTEMMIRQLARSINRTGGYEWLDLVDADKQVLENGKVALSGEILDMVMDITREQKKILEYLNFIGKIDKVALDPQPVSITDAIGSVHNQLSGELRALAAKHDREIALSLPGSIPQGRVNLENRYFPSIVRELVINAIKYSPAGSVITIYPGWVQGADSLVMNLVFSNDALPVNLKGADNEPLMGIPYEYSESVFDMFYTMDSAGHSIDSEEWTDGTGLYITRKLLKRMGGWIRASNASDYSAERPRIVVNMTLELPVLPGK